MGLAHLSLTSGLQRVPDERGGLVGGKVGATPGAWRASHRAQGAGGSEAGTSRPWETPMSPRKFGGARGTGGAHARCSGSWRTVRKTELETKVTPRKPQRTTWEVQSFPSMGLCRGVPCPGAVPSPPLRSRRWTNREGVGQGASVPWANLTTHPGDQTLRVKPIRDEPPSYPVGRCDTRTNCTLWG